jgi:non-specific serine/threonine protein kinase
MRWVVYERPVDGVRHALGEARFAAAMAEGRRMSVEQAIPAVLRAGPTPAAIARPSFPPDRRSADPLTPRELQVAALVARGLTDREIGEALVITAGTVGQHVVHILDKLGLRSRAQVAAWVAERGLHQSGRE